MEKYLGPRRTGTGHDKSAGFITTSELERHHARVYIIHVAIVYFECPAVLPSIARLTH